MGTKTKPEAQGAPASDTPISQNLSVDAADVGGGKTNAMALRTDAGLGFEGMTNEDYSIPFVVVLQKGSPQVDEDSGDQIEGAKAGMFYNTVTGQLYDGKAGIRFIPCHRDHLFVEWIPRDEGGGFVGTFSPEDDQVVKIRREQGKFGRLTIKNGSDDHDLVETFYVYGAIVGEDDALEYVVLSFSSTQIKAYKNWMTTARNITIKDDDGRRKTPPLFGHIYRVQTVPQENKKGSWHGIRVAFDGANAAAARLAEDSELYISAKGFRELVVSGKATANQDAVGGTQSQGDSDTF